MNSHSVSKVRMKILDEQKLKKQIIKAGLNPFTKRSKSQQNLHSYTISNEPEIQEEKSFLPENSYPKVMKEFSKQVHAPSGFVPRK